MPTTLWLKNGVILSVDLEVGQAVYSNIIERDYDKVRIIEELKIAMNTGSHVVAKVSGYPNFIDVGWLHNKPTKTCDLIATLQSQ